MMGAPARGALLMLLPLGSRSVAKARIVQLETPDVSTLAACADPSAQKAIAQDSGR